MRGTETRPYQELNDSIETLGATVGIDVDQTRTILNATVLSQNLDAFLDLLRDVLTNPAFDPAEMNLLQKILYGELTTALQDTRTLASRAMMQAAYSSQVLSWPVEGTIASVSTITPQAAAAFFHAHYVRENMIIAITSPMNRDDLVSKVELKLDPIPHGTLDAKTLPPPALQGGQAVIVDRKGMATTPIFVGISGASDADPAMLQLEAGNFVFGEDFTSRLMQVLRNQHGWTYGAYSSYSQVLRPNAQPGLFSIYLYPSTEYFKDALTTTVSMLQTYVSQGVQASELTFAQSSLANRYPFQLDTAEKRLDWDLRSALTGRSILTSAQYTSQVNGLTLSQLNSTIAAKTNVQNFVIAVVGDSATIQPILSAISGVTSVRVVQVAP